MNRFFSRHFSFIFLSFVLIGLLGVLSPLAADTDSPAREQVGELSTVEVSEREPAIAEGAIETVRDASEIGVGVGDVAIGDAEYAVNNADESLEEAVAEELIIPSLREALKEDKKTETKSTKPVPYEASEFSPALHKLRRAETIFFGSLPVSYLIVSLSHDAYRSSKKITTPMKTKDWVTRFGVTIGLSLSVTLLDYAIGALR